MLKNIDFIKLAHAYGWSFAPDYSTKKDFCIEYSALEYTPKVRLRHGKNFAEELTAFISSFDFDKNVVSSWKEVTGKKPNLEYILIQTKRFMKRMNELKRAADVVGNESRQAWLESIFGMSVEAQIKQYAAENRR